MAADIDVGLAARALIGLCNSVAPWYQRNAALDIEHISRQFAHMFHDGIKP